MQIHTSIASAASAEFIFTLAPENWRINSLIALAEHDLKLAPIILWIHSLITLAERDLKLSPKFLWINDTVKSAATTLKLKLKQMPKIYGSKILQQNLKQPQTFIGSISLTYILKMHLLPTGSTTTLYPVK